MMKASTLVSFNTRTLTNLGFVWTFALLVGGCLVANTSDATDDDDGEGNVVGGGGASVSSTTTGQGQTTSTGGSGDSSGTGGSEPAEEERLCLHASPPTGKGKPFTGYSFSTPDNRQFSFDCTNCPGGRSSIQGLYRFFKRKGGNGQCPGGDCCAPNESCGVDGSKNETFSFDGNIWSRVTNVVGPPTATYTGYYFCPDPTSFTGFKAGSAWTEVFVFETLPPQSQLKPGYSNPCHIRMSGSSVILFECNPQWSPTLQTSSGLSFCKVGEMVDGVTCTDPFQS